jgi:predicted RNA-binding protein with EMAP domain
MNEERLNQMRQVAKKIMEYNEILVNENNQLRDIIGYVKETDEGVAILDEHGALGEGRVDDLREEVEYLKTEIEKRSSRFCIHCFRVTEEQLGRVATEIVTDAGPVFIYEKLGREILDKIRSEGESGG